MVSVRPAVPADADALFADLRPADASELRAQLGPDILPWLHEFVKVDGTIALLDEQDRLLALFGCPAREDGTGCPWMLGTNAITRRRGVLHSYGRRYTKRWFDQFEVLYNVVHAENETAVRWLERLGFSMGDRVQLGPDASEFIVFGRRRDV